MSAPTSTSTEQAVGFFTDTTVCIGCKACEVACKQWNQLPDDGFAFTGNSYDNTMALGASTWRHVAFIEKPSIGTATSDDPFAWLMMSDVCKHCETAACLDACPTGSIIRTEFESVFVQADICNGCGYCVSACPFGVIDRREDDGRAWKCTLCYDRLGSGLTPACAQACPTESIVFGPLPSLVARAKERVSALHDAGVSSAYLYGVDQAGTDGLHAFFLLTDDPEVYNLPSNPVAPAKTIGRAWKSMLLAGAAMALAAVRAASAGRSGR
jgi:formate dehydrogenase iron-sulfur subunit